MEPTDEIQTFRLSLQQERRRSSVGF